MNASDGGAANLAFYEANAKAYAEQTAGADLNHLYSPFLALLPKGARILDVGCGGGRDLKVFGQRGYRPHGIDPSPALAKIASERSGCETSIGRVEQLEFESDFDAVWACASLLHLPMNVLPQALGRIRRALVKEGILFLSMQRGVGEGFDEDGRFVARYESAALRAALTTANFQLLDVWQSEDGLPGREAIKWLNLLAKK
jgi:SAM-dependent methyltransferase